MKKIAVGTALSILIMIFMITASAESVIKSSAPENVTAGRSFTASLSLETDEPIGAVQLHIDSGDEFTVTDVSLIQSGHLRTSKKRNGADLICISDDVFKSGDLLSVKFLSDKNAKAGAYKIAVEVTEAVDDQLHNMTLSPAEIKVTISERNNSSAGSSVRSRAAGTESSNKMTSSRIASSRSSRSSKESSRVSSRTNSSKRRSTISGNADTGSEYEESYDESDDETEAFYPDPEEHFTADTEPAQYVFAGALGACAICGLLAAVYRLGKTSGRSENKNGEE